MHLHETLRKCTKNKRYKELYAKYLLVKIENFEKDMKF